MLTRIRLLILTDTRITSMSGNSRFALNWRNNVRRPDRLEVGGISFQEGSQAGLGRYSQSGVVSDGPGADGLFAASSITSTFARVGAREQTGSVAAASPAMSRAWQRQPPKSSSRRSQVLHGSCIQASPRNFWKAAEVSQISLRPRSFTFSNFIPGI